MKLPPQSPSSLANFEGCPKRWYLTTIERKYPPSQTEAARWGTAVHEKLEAFITGGDPLPDYLEFLTPLVRGLQNGNYKIYAELPISINRNWGIEQWRSASASFRGILDLVAIDADRGFALIVDWKTGKRRPDPSQLLIYAAMLKQLVSVEFVFTAYVWIKDRNYDSFCLDNTNFEEVKAGIIQRLNNIEKAFEEKEFKAKPSPLCPWCPALNDCEEAEKYRKK